MTSRVAWLASIALYGVLPAVILATLFLTANQEGVAAIDFGQFYRAAEKILHGETPYPTHGVQQVVWGGPYPYPPLPALATVPLTVFPIEVARLIVMALLAGSALAILHVLRVQDWRCYGLALLWPPVLSAIQTGNITLFLGLAAALCWRYRDQRVTASISLGVTLAAKFFFWPLVLWFAATRRYANAVLAATIGAALLIVSWGVIRFDGLLGYPERLRKLEAYVGDDSYTLYIVGRDIGLPTGEARLMWLGIGAGLLIGAVGLAWRGDERRAFVLALVASFALTPIVWLHYFALLLVVVALMRSRLGLVWFVPLAMIITPGSGHPTPFETSWTLAVAAVTIGLAMREPAPRSALRPAASSM